MRIVLVIFVCALHVSVAFCQARNRMPEYTEIHVISGMGWGLSTGMTNTVLKPKFSSNLGLNISLKETPYFLYPSMDFLVFGYNQQVHDSNYAYDLEDGRSNFYTLNLAAGVRYRFEYVSTYAFAGPGAGVVVEPRSLVMEQGRRVKIENSSSLSPSFRAGAGADIKLGNFNLFLETSWLHHVKKIQDRPVHVITVYGGLKTDVTRLAGNVTKVIGIDIKN